MAFRAFSLSQGDGFEELTSRIEKGVGSLRGVEVGDQLEVEIILKLLRGRKTVSELVDQIYGLERSDEGFGSSYTRVRRTIKKLESKGLVSTRIFGKEKPYRLTRYAIANMANIGGEEEQVSIMPKEDILVYIITLGLSVPIANLAFGWLELSDPVIALVYACFFYFLGASSSRLIQTFRRVL